MIRAMVALGVLLGVPITGGYLHAYSSAEEAVVSNSVLLEQPLSRFKVPVEQNVVMEASSLSSLAYPWICHLVPGYPGCPKM